MQFLFNSRRAFQILLHEFVQIELEARLFEITVRTYIKNAVQRYQDRVACQRKKSLCCILIVLRSCKLDRVAASYELCMQGSRARAADFVTPRYARFATYLCARMRQPCK